VEKRGAIGMAAQTRFQAVAFDLDGTLYPNYSFYIRLLPFLLKNLAYLRAFGKARDHLRAGVPDGGEDGSFYRRQAAYMGKILKTAPEILEEKTERLIYRGWEPLYKKVKLFPHVIETLTALKEGGVRLGLLSDFPPLAKLEYLGLSGFWDTVLCSEEIGRLKPDSLPFRELASAMGFPPAEILYVGNSFSYDVKGSSRAGMKAAWITGASGGRKKGGADFAFHDYRQLRDFVLI
jgi:putative hydrolase of the HAD superfamily